MFPEVKPIPTTSIAGDCVKAVIAEPGPLGSRPEDNESSLDAEILYIQELQADEQWGGVGARFVH
jgi:hypothetical protein